MLAESTSGRWKRLLPLVPLALATALLAWVATRAILAATGGVPAVPLDDTYIHFQYARSFAELRPLVYSPGARATPGATSWLWPLVLSPFYAVGLRGAALIWVAWGFGWVGLGLLALETQRLALGLLGREAAIAAGAMVLAFGGLIWCAGSGMEIVPFAWLLVRSIRLSADFAEGVGSVRRAELCGFAIAAAFMRPEGALAAGIAAAALALGPRSVSRAWAALPLIGPLLAPALNRIITGEAASTTALVKWLPSIPYFRGERLWQAIFANVELLFGTLFDGRLWSAIFVPSGARVVAWLALPALIAVAWRRKKPWRGALALALALGILIPTTYDSFLWNRLRYLWPFTPGWFIALAALADGVGMLAERWKAGFVRLLVAGGFVGAFATDLPHSIDDLAGSSHAILEQQASLGKWAKSTLPANAVIGVNDTGAIAYFSERRIFDVVGLTTLGEARYWVAGAGSRFEHYEHLPRSALPTHFIVYPEWLSVRPILGRELTERVVNHTILGGTRMVAYVADYSELGSGESPLRADPARVVDRLDVADLESEAAHGYELFWATQAEDRVYENLTLDDDLVERADGGRAGRTLDRFMLEIAPGGTLVARVVTDEAISIRVRVAGTEVGALAVDPSEGFDDHELGLPATVATGRQRVELEAPAGKAFAALHYFSLRPKSAASGP